MKHIAIVADTHVGHIRGLWCSEPLKVRKGSNEDDAVIHHPTALQRYLIKCFDHFIEQVPHGSILVHNGDVIQGFRVPHWHRELVCTDPNDMSRAAVASLKKLRVKCSDAFLIQGTPFHSQDMTDYEQGIADELKMKLYAELDLTVEGKIINFVHGRSKTQKYPTGMIESEFIDALRRAKFEGRKPPDFIVRAHGHRHILVDEMGVICPCWQMPTDFAKRSGKAYITTIGGLILHVDKDMIDCEPIKYALPKSELQAVVIK